MLTKIVGWTTAAMAVFLGLAALVSFVREDATNDCNVAWERKVEQQTAALKLKLAEQAKVIALKDQQLEVAVKAADEAMDNAKKQLEVQRANTPLSDACRACRVPNEYIWLRNTRGSKAPTN